MKNFILILFFVFAIFPFQIVFASEPQQCVDVAGGPIPCPPEEGEEKESPTPIPPTRTFTPTATFTPTSTYTPSPTFTLTPTTTALPTLTFTPTLTPTPTPIPVSQIVIPGAGIGALILFVIVGLIFPIIQKIRVKRRGY